jgi:hypothetical protein
MEARLQQPTTQTCRYDPADYWRWAASTYLLKFMLQEPFMTVF